MFHPSDPKFSHCPPDVSARRGWATFGTNGTLVSLTPRAPALSSICGIHTRYILCPTPAEILFSFPNSLCHAASKVTVQVAMSCFRRLPMYPQKQKITTYGCSIMPPSFKSRMNKSIVLSDEAGLALLQRFQALRYKCSALRSNVLTSPACFAPISMFDDKGNTMGFDVRCALCRCLNLDAVAIMCRDELALSKYFIYITRPSSNPPTLHT